MDRLLITYLYLACLGRSSIRLCSRLSTYSTGALSPLQPRKNWLPTYLLPTY